jgi:hypothetical protein
MNGGQIIKDDFCFPVYRSACLFFKVLQKIVENIVKQRRLLNSSLVGRPAAAAASLPLLRAPLALEVCGRKKDENASRGTNHPIIIFLTILASFHL